MKRILFALILLSLNLSSYSSNPSDEKKKKIACVVGLCLVPFAAFGGPAALSAASATWANLCAKPKGGSTPLTVYKKDW